MKPEGRDHAYCVRSPVEFQFPSICLSMLDIYEQY